MREPKYGACGVSCELTIQDRSTLPFFLLTGLPPNPYGTYSLGPSYGSAAAGYPHMYVMTAPPAATHGSMAQGVMMTAAGAMGTETSQQKAGQQQQPQQQHQQQPRHSQQQQQQPRQQPQQQPATVKGNNTNKS